MKKLIRIKKNRSLLSLAVLLSLAFGHNYVCASEVFSIDNPYYNFHAQAASEYNAAQQDFKNATDALNRLDLKFAKEVTDLSNEALAKKDQKFLDDVNRKYLQYQNENQQQIREINEQLDRAEDRLSAATIQRDKAAAISSESLQSLQDKQFQAMQVRNKAQEEYQRAKRLSDSSYNKYIEAHEDFNSYNALNYDKNKEQFALKAAASYNEYASNLNIASTKKILLDEAINNENDCTELFNIKKTQVDSLREHSGTKVGVPAVKELKEEIARTVAA